MITSLLAISGTALSVPRWLSDADFGAAQAIVNLRSGLAQSHPLYRVVKLSKYRQVQAMGKR